MNVLGQKVTTFHYCPPFKAPLSEVSYRNLGEIRNGPKTVIQKVESSLDGQIYVLKTGKIGEDVLPIQNEKRRKEFNREVRMLTLLNQDGRAYVVQLIAFFILGKKLVLLLPFYRGDLCDFIRGNRGFSFGVTKGITEMLLNILIFLKKHRVIHYDIKPENIFVTFEGDLRLGDFGLACLKEDTEPKILCGQVQYISPEQLENPENVDFSSNLWAVGCVSFATCSNEEFMNSLLDSDDRRGVFEKQLSAVNSLDQRLMKVFLGKQDKNLQEFDLVKDVLKRMLVLNPQERITAEEALRRILL